MATQPIPVRVLVVDDDEMSRELLSVLLGGEGYVVRCVDSGEAALALLSQAGRAPDLVLSDVQMPGTTGARLAGELRRACGPATLLLAISGSRPPEEAISLFDGFLMKPFRMEEIAAVLLARGHRSAAAKIVAIEKRGRVAPGRSRPLWPTTKVVSIDASAPETASKSGMDSHLQEAVSAGTALPGSATGGLVLNEKIYRQLAGSMPTRQLHEMYAMCLNDARERIATMRRLAAARNGEEFVREAHAIKGGCGMLGATELHGMAAELERSGLGDAAAQDAQNIESLDELAAACDRLERMLGSRV